MDITYMHSLFYIFVQRTPSRVNTTDVNTAPVSQTTLGTAIPVTVTTATRGNTATRVSITDLII